MADDLLKKEILDEQLDYARPSKQMLKEMNEIGFIITSFEDNGVGMDDEQIKNIFNPYYTTKASGTGTTGKLINEITLRDTLTAQPHEPYVTALLRICDVHNRPLATNLGSAEIFIKAIDGESE